MGNVNCAPSYEDDADGVILRCHHRKSEYSSDDGEEETFDGEVHTSRRLLVACSPVFATVLTEDAIKNAHEKTINVDFPHDDMALFVRFSQFYAFPMEATPSVHFEVSMARTSVKVLLPVVHYYKCESLWTRLMEWIHEHPDLDLLVLAEHCAGDAIDWPPAVLTVILDEILSKPTASKVVDTKGKWGHRKVGELETGMELISEKKELLEQLSGRTIVRLMSNMVQKRTNAHLNDYAVGGKAGHSRNPSSPTRG